MFEGRREQEMKEFIESEIARVEDEFKKLDTIKSQLEKGLDETHDRQMYLKGRFDLLRLLKKGLDNGSKLGTVE